MECIDENTLVKFSAGQLRSPDANRVEQHIDRCAACQSAVAALLHGSNPDRTVDERPARETNAVRERQVAAGPMPGSTVGRYVLLQLVGRGGMGQVFAAYDPQLDRKVALKLLRPGFDGRDVSSLSARLLREAQAMAKLSHPNVVPVFDAGAYEGDVFIAMEFVNGTTARRWARDVRSWRQVLSAYLQAGRGLAAAHAAGLVHRDFKPENVLITKDGTARVTDFGLVKRGAGDEEEAQDAAGSGELPSAPPPRGSGAEPLLRPVNEVNHALDTPLTEAGVYMGTVGYMAPEVLRGEPADARADQFSFCAATYEALYGEPPFPSNSFSAYRDAVLSGRIRPPPAGARIPARLRRTLERGLSSDPRARFPTLGALLRELSRRNRLPLAVSASIGMAALASAVSYASLMPSPHERCAGADAPIAAAWNPSVKEKIRQAFEAAGRKPQVRDAWPGTEKSIDAWTREWSATASNACMEELASPGAELPLRQQACLDAAREEFSALLRILEHPDDRTITTSVSAIYALPIPRHCANTKQLLVQRPPSSGVGARERAKQAQTALAKVRAARHSGQHAAALSQAEALEASARASGDRAVLADALFELGAQQNYAGRSALGRAALDEADLLAQALGFDWLAARIAIEQVYTHYLIEEPASAHRWADVAQARLERVGGDDGLRAKLLRYRGEVFAKEGRREEGVKMQREGLALARAYYGEDTPLVLVSTVELANTLDSMGEFDEAVPLAEQALAGQLRVHGAASPQSNFARIVLAFVLLDVGEYERAQQLSQESLELAERLFGPDHFRVGDSANNLATALVAMGDVDGAHAMYTRSNAIYLKKFGSNSIYYGSSLNDIARTELARGNVRRAQALARQALEIIGRSTYGAEAALEASREPLLLLGDIALEKRRPREALELFERALAAEESYGPRNVRAAVPLTGIGEAALALGDVVRAVSTLERAVKLRDGRRAPREDDGRTRFAFAKALWAQGGERERARRMALEARDAFSAGAPRERTQVPVIERWLAERGG